MRTRSALALLAAMTLSVALVACIVEVTPPTATRLVGDEHTVTVTVIEPDIPITITPPAGQTRQIVPFTVTFEVISGPNTGKQSDDDCEPSCEGIGEGEISWTYTGDGGVGTDTIRVCVDSPVSEVPDCREVNSTWITPTGTVSPTSTPRPNVGPALGAVGLAASQAAARNQATAAAGQAGAGFPAATGPSAGQAPASQQQAAGAAGVIRPPSTGDGGLADAP
jgi:hypothetical protein